MPQGAYITGTRIFLGGKDMKEKKAKMISTGYRTKDDSIERDIIRFMEHETMLKSPAGYEISDDNFRIEFGSKVREFRTGRKMTQAELAEALQTSQANISYIENGKRNADIRIIFTLKRLDPNIDLNDLLRYTAVTEDHLERKFYTSRLSLNETGLELLEDYMDMLTDNTRLRKQGL